MNIYAIRHAQQTVDRMMEKAFFELGCGITARQYVIMDAIQKTEAPTQTVVVERTGIDRSTVCDVLRRLEAKRYIVKKQKPNDARANIVSLTPMGTNRLNKARRIAEGVENRIAARLHPQDAKRFEAIMAAIITAGDAPRAEAAE